MHFCRSSKHLVVILLLWNIHSVSAQKEANIWYFGSRAGLDFNSGVPVAITNGRMNTLEGCATISDANGDLLFYTDGSDIWNRNHEIMINGTGLNGDNSSTNSAIIIPKPNSSIYYIFTVDSAGDSDGLQYSEVDMDGDGGLGAVTSIKNILLYTPVTEKLTAVKGCNDDCIWVITHKFNSSEFLAYKITDAGINISPVISNTGTFVDSGEMTIGAIKASPKGDKLAVARNSLNVELFDFDAETGNVSNPMILQNYGSNYGVEFSPNGDLLYTGFVFGKGLFQFNLNAGNEDDIMTSRVEISNEMHYGALQLAVDGKIYIATRNSNYLSVINSPNNLGHSCNYQTNAVYLSGKRSMLGLPPFIQSYFNVGVFDHDNTCFGDTTTFKLDDTVDSISWDFGDPASGVNNTSTAFEPSHVFTSPGTYTVSVTATSEGETDTNEQEITIYELPAATRPQDILVCDDDNDGFYNFDLTQQDAAILNGLDASVFEVRYYASAVDYTSNTAISNPSSYGNSTAYAHETIVAAVMNRGNNACDDITNFTIHVFEVPTPSQTISKLSFCDNTSFGTDTDGIIQFDLTTNETEILNGQAASDFDVTYFRDAALLDQIPNPSQYENTNARENIYVKVTSNSNSSCEATTAFEIEVLELPVSTALVELKQCDDDLDRFSMFNLNEVISEISANAINETITFHEALSDAESGINAIQNITSYPNQNVSTDRIWTRVENNNKCFRTVEVNLIVSTTQIPISYTRDFYECDDALDGDITNGISEFNFSNVTSEIEAIFPVGQQLIISYYKTQENALAENNAIVDISNYRNSDSPNTQDIYIRVDSALDNDCLGLGQHITLHVEEQPIAYPITIPEQCDDDGDTMFAFDTSTIEDDLLQGQTGMSVTYTDAMGRVLPSPLPNPFLSGTQSVIARVTNATSQDIDRSCFDETVLNFNVDAAAVAYPVNDIVNCDDNDDLMFPFDTSTIESTLLNGQQNMIVTYKDENGDNLPSPLPNPFLSPTISITARVENTLSNICYDEITFNLIVVEQPVLYMDDTWLICEGDSVNIISDEGYDAYEWSTGEIGNTITVFNPGNYTIKAINIYENVSCETTKQLTVLSSNIATITNIEIEDWTQNNNVIRIFVDGDGDYEYSVNGINYQDSSVFTDLRIGDYTAYVRDKNGCGITEQEIFLMYYPKFFTPNNDGYHDTWHIYNASLEPNSTIHIYNRYGKLIKQLNPNSDGWDGTINGKLMPTEDYWFTVQRQNGKIHSGHFTLKR